MSKHQFVLGCKLNLTLDETLDILRNHYTEPPTLPENNEHELDWYNTQLPGHLLIEYHNDKLYLTLGDVNNTPVEEMDQYIRAVNIGAYMNVLGQFKIEYTTPRLMCIDDVADGNRI